MANLTVLALLAVIAALLAGSVFIQTVMVIANARELDEGLADLSAPYLVLATVVLGIVTVQIVLVCVWRLLTMVRHGTVFSHAAFRYVDIVIGAIVAAALLLFVLAVLLTPGEEVAPGMILMMGGAVLAVFGVALVVLIMRMLLAQAVARDAEAAQLQAELEDVI